MLNHHYKLLNNNLIFNLITIFLFLNFVLHLNQHIQYFQMANNQNIYIDIENFLWENKQEPISNPDNNTRILAAGFDLKTSFRNVK